MFAKEDYHDAFGQVCGEEVALTTRWVEARFMFSARPRTSSAREFEMTTPVWAPSGAPTFHGGSARIPVQLSQNYGPIVVDGSFAATGLGAWNPAGMGCLAVPPAEVLLTEALLKMICLCICLVFFTVFRYSYIHRILLRTKTVG